MKGPILVLGAGGFIGRQLVRILAQHGEQVIAASRSHVEFDSVNVKTLVGALRPPEDFAPLVARSRVIVYLASTSTPGSSAGHPTDDVTGNLLPLTALRQALQEHADVDTAVFVLGERSIHRRVTARRMRKCRFGRSTDGERSARRQRMQWRGYQFERTVRGIADSDGYSIASTL